MPSDLQAQTVSPKATVSDPGSISKSMTNPVEFVDIRSFISRRKKFLVVVNDHTRPTPTASVLRELELKGKDVTTIVANGTHRAPTKQELEDILGGRDATPPYGGEVRIHDSRDNSSLVEFGRTRRGTKLLINRLLAEAEGIIVVGSVEPHYFAGYTGGRKFLLPGLAGLESIVMNHALAADESSRIIKLEGNPVHEDFMDALDRFGRFDDIFSIQLVLNAQHQVSYASSGHIVHSFVKAVERAEETYVPPVKGRADIVISVAKPPMDCDLYQSQKALDNVKLAVNEGGIIILVSRCKDGIGDRGFYNLLTGADSMDPHKFGFHKAVKMKKLLQNTTVFAVSDLPPTVAKSISITPFPDIQTAFDRATEIKGKHANALIVLDGGLVVPKPSEL